MKEQQLAEVHDSQGAADKSRQAAERSTEAACQAKRRLESEVSRLHRLVAQLESGKR